MSRRRLTFAVLAALSLAGAARAAEAPDRLSAEVQGVVGSGDQLSLRLSDAAGGRTVAVGEVYADGWILTGLTPAKATLAKEGATREVGLNPDGRVAVAAAPVAPTTVTLVGLPDAATIERYLAMGETRFGLSRPTSQDPEALRMGAYGIMTLEEQARRIGKTDPGLPRGAAPLDMSTDVRALLGETAYADMQEIMHKAQQVAYAQQAADVAANPITGPSTFYQPAGVDFRTAQAQAGVDPRGVWFPGRPDAQGGQVMTRAYQSGAEMQAAQQAAGRP